MSRLETANNRPRVAFATVGCRLNQAEADATCDEFTSRGWQVVHFGQSAELVMINTCTVTGRADRSSRQLIHRARRDNPEAIVVAAGCFAASHAEGLAAESEVDIILGVNEKVRPFDYIPESGRPAKPLIYVNDADSEVRTAVGTRVSGRSRAFLKVQDGCDHTCTYCAVTLVRGPSRSAPLDDIKAALRRIIAAGFEEVIFTGVD
ncbi:MAG: radical SAM protein, partial [bacterium]